MSWIKIEDQLPPFSELVWVYGGDAGITLAERSENESGWHWEIINDTYFIEDEDQIIVDTYWEDINPTHWHPLPKLPALNNTLTLSKQVDSVGNYEQTGYMPGKIEPPTDRGWWCTVCHKPVDGNDVAVEELFKETHDVKKGGCGGKVIIKKHEP